MATLLEEKQTSDNEGNDHDVMTGKIRIEWHDLDTPSLKCVQSKHKKSTQANAKSDQHSKKNKVSEEKQQHRHADRKKVVTTTSTTGAAVGALTYAAVTVEEGFILGAGGELLFAAGVTAYGALLFSGVGGAALLAHAGYTKWCQVAEENKFNKKQKHNAEVKLFNARFAEFKALAAELDDLASKLKAQEDKINNKIFFLERYGPHTKVIVAIGPTGYGKSLVCNRLIGDQREIYDLSETKNAPFDVAALGDTKSNTKDLSKLSKRIRIMKGDTMKREFILSVVDTQGAFDSDGDDAHFLNEMAEYFRACGGVNMFAIFFKFGTKNDKNYRDLLKLYATFWGDKFWKKCVIIVTNCDRDSKKTIRALNTGYQKTVEQIREFLCEVSKGLADDIPIYQFGEDNFESSTVDLLPSLVDSRTVYKEKYRCDKIKSPMDKLWDQIQPKIRKFEFLHKELQNLSKMINASASKIPK